MSRETEKPTAFPLHNSIHSSDGADHSRDASLHSEHSDNFLFDFLKSVKKKIQLFLIWAKKKELANFFFLVLIAGFMGVLIGLNPIANFLLNTLSIVNSVLFFQIAIPLIFFSVFSLAFARTNPYGFKRTITLALLFLFTIALIAILFFLITSTPALVVTRTFTIFASVAAFFYFSWGKGVKEYLFFGFSTAAVLVVIILAPISSSVVLLIGVLNILSVLLLNKLKLRGDVEKLPEDIVEKFRKQAFLQARQELSSENLKVFTARICSKDIQENLKKQIELSAERLPKDPITRERSVNLMAGILVATLYKFPFFLEEENCKTSIASFYVKASYLAEKFNNLSNGVPEDQGFLLGWWLIHELGVPGLVTNVGYEPDKKPPCWIVKGQREEIAKTLERYQQHIETEAEKLKETNQTDEEIYNIVEQTFKQHKEYFQKSFSEKVIISLQKNFSLVGGKLFPEVTQKYKGCLEVWANWFIAMSEGCVAKNEYRDRISNLMAGMLAYVLTLDHGRSLFDNPQKNEDLVGAFYD